MSSTSFGFGSGASSSGCFGGFSFSAVKHDLEQGEAQNGEAGEKPGKAKRSKGAGVCKAMADAAAHEGTPTKRGGAKADRVLATLSGGIGRPKRDLDKTTQSSIESFRASDAGSNYFGEESKTVRRFLERLLADMDKKLETTKEVTKQKTKT